MSYRHHPLPAPAEIHRRRRRLFDPRRGPIRRTQRWLSNFLAFSIYPRVPRVRGTYERQLRRSLVVSRADIPIPGLPGAFDGLRVLLLTDLHAGPFVRPAIFRRLIRRLRSLAPDLVLLGGDLVTRRAEEFLANREAFRELRAPLGTYAVLGNHDHYTRETVRLREMVESAGIGVLVNESVFLCRGRDRLSLAGMDDLLVGDPDLDAALADTRPPVVLLSHNPDVLFEAARRDVALVLSGHTHGGQIRIPGMPVIVRQSRYHLDEGRYRAGRTELVVSRGFGAVGLPLRLNCPPETVLLVLRAEG